MPRQRMVNFFQSEGFCYVDYHLAGCLSVGTGRHIGSRWRGISYAMVASMTKKDNPWVLVFNRSPVPSLYLLDTDQCRYTPCCVTRCREDRKSVVMGRSGSVRVELGGRPLNKK